MTRFQGGEFEPNAAPLLATGESSLLPEQGESVQPSSPGAKPDGEAIRPVVLQLKPRGSFVDWLAASGGALAVTTYNSGRFVILTAAEGQLRHAVWKFARPMGLAVAGDQLAIIVRDRILTYRRVDQDGRTRFASQAVYETGLLDAHDAAWGRRGLYFVNTRFNCLARPSDRVRFLRSWQPGFIPGVVARDACHLNGLALRKGLPGMVTAFCESSAPKGWKHEDRFSSGVVVNVRDNEVVVRGLCMPHSPRWHAGKWWLCNSGEGSLCTFDPRRGDWTEAALLPGFTRGLCFVNDAAVVGMSRIRRRHILDAPPVRERCRDTVAGIGVVELCSGRLVGELEFVRGGSEVYDVVFLPGARRVELDGVAPAIPVTGS